MRTERKMLEKGKAKREGDMIERGSRETRETESGRERTHRKGERANRWKREIERHEKHMRNHEKPLETMRKHAYFRLKDIARYIKSAMLTSSRM